MTGAVTDTRDRLVIDRTVLARLRWADLRCVLEETARLWRPPPRLRLSEWAEREIVLPAGMAAVPGPLRLWPYQRGIADAIADSGIERVTVVKPVRIGYTTLLTAAIAGFVANDPSPILLVVPTMDDARDYVVSELEPLMAAVPSLARALMDDTALVDRSTMLSRRFPGGSLKVVAAKAPRNLRRHTARVLLIDEADAMLPGPEGSPILLAERRTLSFPDRKIVLGSTPTHAESSPVLRAYAQSDRRVYEWPCPRCHQYAEPQWGQMRWVAEDPETVRWVCPHCEAAIGESAKASMVAAGRWRATAPEVRGHAGFRLSALVSLSPHARWPQLVVEFLRAKRDPAELQVFCNTLLAEGWRTAEALDEQDLLRVVASISLESIPAEVGAMTAGVDVQGDRLEVTICGWSPTTCYVLGHVVLWGSPMDEPVWAELDALLARTWDCGGVARTIDAAIVDAGDMTDAVYRYCGPRWRRRIWAGKGHAGPRPACKPSDRSYRRSGARLMIVGVDGLKDRIAAMIQSGRGLVLSQALPASYHAQLTAEQSVVRYVRGQPVRQWERRRWRAAEALDCLVYAMAARAQLGDAIDWGARRRGPAGSVAADGVAAAVVSRRGWSAAAVERSLPTARRRVQSAYVARLTGG